MTPHSSRVLATIIATCVAAAPDVAPAQSAATRAPLARRDSTRALKAAKRAQNDFEQLRRPLLPSQDGLSGQVCQVVIGRYCHSQAMGEGPPPESPKVVAKRLWLIATLDSLGRELPGDRFIIGQRLRYRMEIGRVDESRRIAEQCARAAQADETRRWCLALAGYASQELGDYGGADSAFAAALATMPEKERCGWQDMSMLLDGKTAGRFRRAGCAGRDSVATALWRVVQPLYLTGVNDLRTEFLARVTRMRIEQDTRTPMSAYQDADDRETLLRFGGGLWYTQESSWEGTSRSTVVASHRRGPAFDFFPEGGVLASLDRLRLGDWAFSGVMPRVGYAPAYAQSFQPLEHQVAVFRRGDSALVVGAFDVGAAPDAGGAVEAGIFAAPFASVGVAAPIGALLPAGQRANVATVRAPWQPMLVSLEVLDRHTRTAARARYAVSPPAGGSRFTLSDLLLYAPNGTVPTSLTDAVPRALHAMRATRGVPLGLYWEAYGANAGGAETVDFALLVEPTGDGWVRRAFDRLRRKEKTGLALRWREVPAIADGIAPRALEVDLSLLRPGRYRMRLVLDEKSPTPTIATREIELVDR